MNLQKAGLPITKVALMQLRSGLPSAAMNTLVANGFSAAKAKKFLRRASVMGADVLKTPSEYQSTSDEDLDGMDDTDDDPMMSEDGYTTITPHFDEDEMLIALEDPPDDEPQAEDPPQEAYEAMKFQTPLDKEEEFLLSTTPFLQDDPHGHGDPIRWIDEPDHEEWLENRASEKHKGMDEVLEDTMYGNLTEEEMMDRAGSEVGRFGLSSLKKGLRSAGRGLKKAGRVATMPVAKLASVVKKFVPGRDAGKAKMVKSLNAKLVREHANWLATNDRKRGVKKPVSAYVPTARLWAKNKLQQAGLPTSFTSGSTVAGNILGSDSCGDWWNPLSWFKAKAKYVLINTEGERVAEMSETEYQAYAGTKAAMATSQQPQEEGAPSPEEAPQEPQEPSAEEAPPEDASEGDFASDLTSAFQKGRKAGEEHLDESEGDDMIGKYYRSIKDPLADIEGGLAIAGNGDIVRTGDFVGNLTRRFVQSRSRGDFSEGAAEEALVEATGDADVGRHFRPGIRAARFMNRRGGGWGGRPGFKGPPASPEAQALKTSIKTQLASKVVSQALVTKWAAARAGQPDGNLFNKFYARMGRCIAKRGGTISADKSETAGMGDFVGWA